MAVSIILIAVIAYFSYFISSNIYKKSINPVTVFITVNLISILLMYGIAMIDSSFSGTTIWLIFSSFFFYIIGLLIGGNINITIMPKSKLTKTRKVTSFIRLKYCILLYMIVFNISTIFYFFDLQTRVGIPIIIKNLSQFNSMIQEGFFSGKIYNYILPIGITLSLLIIFYIKKTNTKYKTLLVIQLIICFIPFISVRRDLLFKMILMDFLLFYFLNSDIRKIKSHKETLKNIMLFVIVAIGSLSFLSFSQKLLNKSSVAMDLKFFGIPLPSFLNDPIIYLAGNYAYFNEQVISNHVHFVSPLISTFRLFYIYILNRLIEVKTDTITPFALKFFSFDVQGNLINFNTTPIQYYISIESGIFNILFFNVLGYICAKAFKSLKTQSNIGSMMLSIVLFSLLFWSFRGYDFIYLNTMIILVSMSIVKLLTDTRKQVHD